MANYTGNDNPNGFTGGSDPDVAVGNGGNDTFNGAGGNDILVGNAGSDILNGGAADDVLFGGDRYDAFGYPFSITAANNPVLDRNGEADTLNGGDGDDFIFAGYNDTVNGGAGTNYVYLSLQGATSGVTLGTANGSGTFTNVSEFSYVEGSNYDDVITLFSTTYNRSPEASGMGGNDVLTASYNTRNLYGNEGNDTLDGRPSQYLDRLEGGSGDDTLYTNANTFGTAVGGEGNDVIYAHGQIYGGSGNDRIYISQTYYGGLVYGEEGDDEIHASDQGRFISGGSGADTLIGGAGDDVLTSDDFGQVGYIPSVDNRTDADVLTGGGGNDQIGGGIGDRLDGEAGTDVVHLSYGGATAGVNVNTANIGSAGWTNIGGIYVRNFESLEKVTGSAFADVITIATQSSAATVDGAGGNDIVRSMNSSVLVNGGEGNDRFISGAYGDVFNGGAGIDAVDYRSYAIGVSVALAAVPGQVGMGADGDQLIDVENIFGSAHADTLTGNGVANAIDGGLGNDTIAGLAGNDVLTGGGGDDRLEGGDNDDTLTGGEGADQLLGGAGNDGYTVGDANDTIVEAIGGGTDTVTLSLAAGSSYTLADNVERLKVMTAGVTGRGNGLDNQLSTFGTGTALLGEGGNDTLIGSVHADVLDGGTGNDIMRGAAGDDLYRVDSLGDVVTEYAGQGVDTVESAIGWTLGAELEHLTLIGAGAIDGTGNALANTITGNGAANVLNGAGGADRLVGGLGDDVYVVDGTDTIVETAGQGSDTARVAASYVLAAGLSIETLTTTDAAGTAAINLTGNGEANRIVGNAGNNTLNGGGGNDALEGGAGGDSLNGGAGADAMTGGSGNDVYVVDNAGDTVVELAGGGTDSISLTAAINDYMLPDNVERLVVLSSGILVWGNDLDNILTSGGRDNILYGGLGNDRVVGDVNTNVLSGNEGNDLIQGGGGDDFIDGGAGNDVMEGGAGRDYFRFYAEEGQDIVSDFTDGVDLIDLTGWGLYYDVSGYDEIADQISQSGADTLIDLGGGNVIRLTGVDRATITEDDFTFTLGIQTLAESGDALAPVFDPPSALLYHFF